MAIRSRKIGRKMSEKDRQLESLLSSAFRALNPAKLPVPIETSKGKQFGKVRCEGVGTPHYASD